MHSNQEVILRGRVRGWCIGTLNVAANLTQCGYIEFAGTKRYSWSC